jgi:hypothetical protein
MSTCIINKIPQNLSPPPSTMATPPSATQRRLSAHDTETHNDGARPLTHDGGDRQRDAWQQRRSAIWLAHIKLGIAYASFDFFFLM